MAHFSKYYMLKFSLEHFSEPRKAEENVIKQKKKNRVSLQFIE